MLAKLAAFMATPLLAASAVEEPAAAVLGLGLIASLCYQTLGSTEEQLKSATYDAKAESAALKNTTITSTLNRVVRIALGAV